jgi:hypothetical protein
MKLVSNNMHVVGEGRSGRVVGSTSTTKATKDSGRNVAGGFHIRWENKGKIVHQK